MPSAFTPCMSPLSVITTLCPIAATGMVPVCTSVIVKSSHDEGMVIDFVLNCIASLPSISTSQAPPADAVASWGAASAESAGAVSAGAMSPGAASVVAGGVCAGDVSAGAVDGVAAGSAVGEASSPPHADSANAQAVAKRAVLIFM